MASAVTPIRPNTKKKDPSTEYVSAGNLYGVGLRSLPQSNDELTREVSHDVYDRMANDPEISAGTNILIQSVLADGVQVTPAAVYGEDGEIDPKAQEIAEGFEYALSNLQRPFVRILEQMLRSALRHGNKVAEVTYNEQPETVNGKRLLTIKSIKPKPRNVVAFVVDEFLNLYGFTYRKINGGFVAGSQLQQTDILPREQAAVLTLGMLDEDPRGVSWYRPAYNGWNLKMLNYPSYLKYLLRCAIPGLIGIAGENAAGEQSEDGEPLSATQVLLNALITFENSTAIALGPGSEVKPLEVQGEGEVFTKAFEFFNKEIRKAILFNELANSDSQHQTKNATESQSDFIEMATWYLKNLVAEMIETDIARPWVVYNYGKDALQYLPSVSLGDSDRKDWSEDGETVDKLLKNEELYPSQKQYLTTVIGLPAPKQEEIAARDEQRQQMQEALKNGNRGTEEGKGKEDSTKRQGTGQSEPDKEAGRGQSA